MLRFAYLLLPVALMSLSACAGNQGFDRMAMQDVMRQTVNLPEQQAAAGATEPAPATAAPFRLGLFFTQKQFPTRQAIKPVEWLSRDKDVLLRTLAPMQDRHILRDVIVIANSTVQNSGLSDIRTAAARYGADVIVIVTGVGAVDRYNNGYSALYPTIIGAYLAPGTVSEGLFLVEGSLWDVRSGFAYGTQAAEGRSKLVGSATTVEDRAAIEEAKAAALRSFGERLADLLNLVAHPSSNPGQGSR